MQSQCHVIDTKITRVYSIHLDSLIIQLLRCILIVSLYNVLGWRGKRGGRFSHWAVIHRDKWTWRWDKARLRQWDRVISALNDLERLIWVDAPSRRCRDMECALILNIDSGNICFFCVKKIWQCFLKKSKHQWNSFPRIRDLLVLN